jgi:hypothetical protein
MDISSVFSLFTYGFIQRYLPELNMNHAFINSIQTARVKTEQLQERAEVLFYKNLQDLIYPFKVFLIINCLWFVILTFFLISKCY